MTAAMGDRFDADRDARNFGSGAAPGRPGQVIRLHPRTGQRHLDWLTWGLLPPATETSHGASRPIHARAETVAELPMFAEAFTGVYPTVRTEHHTAADHRASADLTSRADFSTCFDHRLGAYLSGIRHDMPRLP